MTPPVTAPDRDDVQGLIEDQGQDLMTSATRFINREISWLGFNERVLAEARRESHPLLERLRFVAISATNLEEFIMVRLAGLKAQVRARVGATSPDGLSAEQQVDITSARVRDLQNQQLEVWRGLRDELAGVKIEVLERD